MWRSCRSLTALACSFWLMHSPSLAQPADDEAELAMAYGDHSSISLATGNRQPLRRAPAVATVITAEDIANMGATDLDQVLETVPGVHISRSSISYSPLPLIRGIHSQFTPQTLMLQNGVPITILFQGNRGGSWAGYPVDHIARIEIIRGPGSALYGADAFAGVINIITKSAAETPGTQAGVRHGSFDTRDAWLQHGGKFGPLDVAGYLRVGHTDGFKKTVARDAQSLNDTTFGTQASLAPGTVNTGYDAIDGNLELGHGQWRLRGGYKLRDHVGNGMGVAAALDPVGHSKSERITAELVWLDTQISPDWEAGAMAGLLQYNDTMPSPLVLYPAGATFGTGSFPNGMIGAPEKWERHYRLSAHAIYSGLAWHRLRLGVGYDDLDLYKTREHKNFTFNSAGVPVPIDEVSDFSESGPFLRPQRRRIHSVYAQDEWNFAQDWTLTAGLRHDRFSDVGNSTNPRLALVWDASLDLTAKLLYGKAFRAPAFTELHSINNPVIRGNPQLRPETIRTWELAFSWLPRRDFSSHLGVFHYRMEDIIRTVASPTVGTGADFRNTGRQRGAGLELELAWQARHDLRLMGHYAYQKSIDLGSGQDAGYAPHHHLYARGEWRVSPGLLFAPQVNHVQGRKRAATDARSPVPDYTTLDLALRTRRENSDWSFSASVLNLFNANVREPSLAPGRAIPDDLPMAGRAFMLQAIYKM